MLFEIFGLIFSIILGTLGHFLYNLSNMNKIIGFVFANNESFFEHLKLGITPILLWTIIEFLTNNFNNLFFSKFICILIFAFILMILYYGYKFFLKKNILFLDILIFYISLTLAYFVSINILIYTSFNIFLNIIGIIGIVGVIFSYIIFN